MDREEKMRIRVKVSSWKTELRAACPVPTPERNLLNCHESHARRGTTWLFVGCGQGQVPGSLWETHFQATELLGRKRRKKKRSF